MLLKLKFQFPEILIGLLIAVAIFAMGMLYSSQHPENDPSKNPITHQEVLSASTEDRIFGWQAINVFTGLLFVATVGLGVVSAIGIRIQIRDTRILQRAYIAVEPLGIYSMIGQDRGAVIGHVGMRNAGRLPARNLKWFVTIKPSNNPEEKSFPVDEAEIKGDLVVPVGVIARRGSGEKISERQLLIEADARRLTGVDGDESRLFLYVWGIARYDDGFGKARFTKFCHRYNFVMRSPEGLCFISPEHARYHEYGNDAD